MSYSTYRDEMTDKKPALRLAEQTDIPALSVLMNELGYYTTEEEMEVRFLAIQSHPDYKTIVATIENQVAGMIGLSKNYSYEQNGIYVRVLALVTAHEFRQQGIGKTLMEAAENWAVEIGADTVLLNSGNREERAVAKTFYLGIGYEIKSSGFRKKLQR